MCGRYNIIDSPPLRDLMAILGIDSILPSQYNIAPTEQVPVVIHDEDRSDKNKNALKSMRWWLVPSWSPEVSTKYSMFNARSESLLTSKAFASPFKKRRGIIPASQFIEWKKQGKIKQPYLIEPEASTNNKYEALAFAGIWEHWEKDGQSIDSCAIITTDADPSFEDIHHRMPVMLCGDEIDLWLNPDSEIDDVLALMQSRLVQPLKITPIDTQVNNARNKHPEHQVSTGESFSIKPT